MKKELFLEENTKVVQIIYIWHKSNETATQEPTLRKLRHLTFIIMTQKFT